ncbi:MAG: IclR family transcriptional regulator [Caldimonas sp.]
MTTDFPTASVGSSQAPTAAVEKSHSASNTEIQTLPPEAAPTLLKVRDMLVLIAAEPGVGLPDLSRRLSLPKSTAHRILSALEASGFVLKIEGGHRFGLGPLISDLTQGFTRREKLIRVTRPMMVRLRDRCDETVALHVLEANRRLVIDQVESTQELRRTFTNLGVPMSLGATAAGKIFLAYMSERERAAYLKEHALPSYTAHTPRPSRLRNDLAQILRRGYATSFEEVVVGVAGIAMPVHGLDGRVSAAIGISGPKDRFTATKLVTMRLLLRASVKEATELLAAEG